MFLEFAALAMAPLGADFNPFDAAAREWLETHAFELVQGVTRTTIDQLRRTLTEGWEAGEGIPELADRVREVFEEADRYRSFLIARTETTATANMAQLSVLRQAGIGYKTWSTSDDERVCPVCGPLDGKTVRLDEEFAPGIFAPPAHPNCRCSALAPTELDEVEVRKYPGQQRDRQGRFAPGKQVWIKGLGKNATEAQRRTVEKVKALGREAFAAKLEAARGCTMSRKTALSHRKHWAEVGAKSAESYMASAKNTVADAERIFVLDYSGDLQFAFTTGVAGSGWRVSVASTSLGGLVTHYGPYSGVPLEFDRMIRYRASNGWVEVTGVTDGG